MRLLEDLHLVENRGSGIRTMLEAMRAANLAPPHFRDRRSSFWVTFYNHTLMNPQAIAWLNQFAAQPLNDHQRLALVYLRHNDQMTNKEYQRLNHVDQLTAYHDLRGLVQLGLLQQHSTRRWTYYTLDVSVIVETPSPIYTNEERIMAYIREHGSINNAECRTLLGVEAARAWYQLRLLHERGLLKQVGKTRWRRYELA
jgi:ATP-dependent DNA helicase RecG